MNRCKRRKVSEKSMNVSLDEKHLSDTRVNDDDLEDMELSLVNNSNRMFRREPSNKSDRKLRRRTIQVTRASMSGAPRKSIDSQANIKRYSLNVKKECPEDNGSSSSRDSGNGSMVSPVVAKTHENSAADFFLFRRKKPPGEDVFSKLSDEMLLSIFQYLPKKTLTRCALVCKRWNRVTCDEALWTRLDLALRPITSGGLGYALMRGVVILRLAQSELPDPIFRRNSPFALKEDICKLQYLDLSMAVISSKGLEDILAVCRHLKKLSLEHCELTEKSCTSIGLNQDLEVLNLALCYGLTEECVDLIVSGCRCLSSLNVAWTNLSEEALDIMCPNLPGTLRRLNISGCRRTLTDARVEQLVEACPDLLELDVSDCTMLTDVSIDAICNLKTVEYLAFSRCYAIPAQSYLLLSAIPTLLYLDIFGLLTEQSLVGLQQVLAGVIVNKFMFSSVARPTTGIRRTSIWGLRVRD